MERPVDVKRVIGMYPIDAELDEKVIHRENISVEVIDIAMEIID